MVQCKTGTIAVLKAENEQMKKEIWKLRHRQMWDKEATLQAELLIKENELLKETNLQLQTIDMEIDRNNKYRKALEEIREIAKENMNCEGESNPCPQSQDILDKISEVLR